MKKVLLNLLDILKSPASFFGSKSESILSQVFLNNSAQVILKNAGKPVKQEPK